MGGDGDTKNTICHAYYLEAVHQRVLFRHGFHEADVSFVDALNAALGQSPYGAYEQVNVGDGYLGGSHDVKDFPSLWEMFGNFMSGLDIHNLWGQVYEDVIQGPEIENAVSAQSALLQDAIDTTVMPKFLAGMRDINSVMSSTFVIGKAIIQDAHVKSINKFSSQIRITALNMANDQWAKHLSWNESVVRTFSDMFKLYYTSKLDVDRVNLEYQAKDKMWDINLFEPARAIIGALNGAAATTTSGGNEPSQTQKAVGGAMAGAAVGTEVYPGWGTLIGGVLGAAMSYL